MSECRVCNKPMRFHMPAPFPHPGGRMKQFEAVTDKQRADIKTMTTAHVRRNYWVCQGQLDVIGASRYPEQYDVPYRQIYAWQMAYLDDLVERGEQI